MTTKNMLAATSLFSVLLLSLHLAQDALHARPGTRDAGPGNLVAILIVFVLLVGPALLAERRSGQILMVLGALFAIGMPVLHFNLGGDLNRQKQALLFVWCLIALGVAGLLSLVLLVSEIPRVWREQRKQRETVMRQSSRA